MAATGLVFNWSLVQLGSEPLTKITNGTVSHGGNLVPFSGDANIYDIVLAVGVNKPTMSFNSGDIGTIEATFGNSIGSPIASPGVEAKINDALGATSGGVEFTMFPATVSDISHSAAHANYGAGTITVMGYSSDGTTPPISVSRF